MVAAGSGSRNWGAWNELGITGVALSRYRIVWLFVMFDLPVETKDQRREYTQFRNRLLKRGFTMLQYSVYAKHLPTEDAAEPLKAHVHAALPPMGQVRVLAVTAPVQQDGGLFWQKTATGGGPSTTN